MEQSRDPVSTEYWSVRKPVGTAIERGKPSEHVVMVC